MTTLRDRRRAKKGPDGVQLEGQPLRGVLAENLPTARDVRSLFLPLLPAASPPESLPMPSPIPSLWGLLRAAVEEGDARRVCEDLKRNRQLKNAVLEGAQSGVLMRWLGEHRDVRAEVSLHHAPEPGRRGRYEGLPITTDWFPEIAWQDDDGGGNSECGQLVRRARVRLGGIASAIRRDREGDAQALAVLEVVEPEEWPRDDVESLRGRVVAVHLNNALSSPERVQQVIQELRGIAADVVTFDSRDPTFDIMEELAACELFGFRIRRCRFGHHYTVGDYHFRSNCKKCQKEKRLRELQRYKARKRR